MNTQENITHKRVLTVYIDGASRGNPGCSGIGIYAKNPLGKVILASGFATGHQTNNQAEYTALLYALYFFSRHLTIEQQKKYHLAFISDSRLLVEQQKGNFKVKDAELKKMDRVGKLLQQNLSVSFTHTLRENNQHADEMANQGIDTRQYLAEDFITFLKSHDVILSNNVTCPHTKAT